MKNAINTSNNISVNFDKELAAILKNDLKQFHSAKGKFLNLNNNNQQQNNLLVA